MELIDIVDRLSDEQVLELCYRAGCKPLDISKLKKNSKGQYNIRCFGHEDEDNPKRGKKPSFFINPDTGVYHCKSCSAKGNMVKIAYLILGEENYPKALQLLADEANVSLDSRTAQQTPREKPKPKPIEYIRFDREKPVANIEIDQWLPKLDKMTEAQQFKLMLTAIYRSSLKTDQSKKLAYYGGRRITNQRTQLIGFIHKDDVDFWKPIEEQFGLERLIKFGFYNDAKHEKNPLAFKYQWIDVNFVPSFDLYTDLITGAMLRPTVKMKTAVKEFSLSKHSIVQPMPFAITHDILADCEEPIWFTEGSVDGLSLGASRIFAAIPGVNGISDEMLGLFEGKTIVLALDADGAGQKAIFGYEDGLGVFQDGLLQRMYKAGVSKVLIAKWDPIYGKDLNDLLQAGHLNKISVSDAPLR